MTSHLNSIPADVCLGEVPPLNRRKLVAFFNCFIQKSTSLLNDLALKSENLITEMEKHLRVMDARLTILEKKVSDINVQQNESKIMENPRNDPVDLITLVEEETAAPQPQAVSPEPNDVCEKYYKMLRMGVPEAAVKLKMKAENVDPNLLITDPNKMKPKIEEDALSEASESSVEFTDSE